MARASKTANANSAGRWLWYVVIGVCLVAVLVIWADSSHGKFDDGYDKWAQLAILTAVIFGYLLKWGWRYRRSAKFWAFYLVVFIGHCVVYVPIFSRGRWPILMLGLVGAVETMTLAACIALTMRHRH